MNEVCVVLGDHFDCRIIEELGGVGECLMAQRVQVSMTEVQFLK